jgi:hypothetical protein
LAVIVDDCPVQMVDEEADRETVGVTCELIVTLLTAEPQPFVKVTVYTPEFETEVVCVVAPLL